MEKPGIRPITIRLTSYTIDVRYFGNGVKKMGIAAAGFGGFTSTGVILVLFILLVIVSRAILI